MAVQFKRGTAVGSLSLTPLIDIVFLLLIFFIVTSRFAQQDLEMDVQLPTATEAQPLVSQPTEVFLHIDDRGQFFIGRQQVEPADLEQQLSDMLLQNPLNQTVVIRADGRSTYQRVSLAVDICHRAGVQDVRLPQQAEGN